jgi:hypothetical protein
MLPVDLQTYYLPAAVTRNFHSLKIQTLEERISAREHMKREPPGRK